MIMKGVKGNMVEEITCPRCGNIMITNNRYCENCGTNISIAAVLAEQQAILPIEIPKGISVTPELLVPRIGDYLIERGMLEPEQLQFALKHQEEKSSTKKPILLGQALLELEFIDRETLDQVVTAQILELQNALNQVNQNLQRRVEERTKELQIALERLSEINNLKSNFIANISHELRTPLTHLKGYLEILADGSLGSITEDQKEALNVLKRSEARLERLIEEMIQFSVASQGKLNLTPEDFDVRKLIQTTIERLDQRANEKEITLLTELPEEIPLVHADKERIGWVIFQLLDNALKFTNKGGKVNVLVKCENNKVLISVTDTGIGIPNDRILEIFEPFHQLDGSTTRRYEGTGLGLAMVRRIIEAHGAQVEVRSIVKAGSCFEFWLPIQKKDEERKNPLEES